MRGLLTGIGLVIVAGVFSTSSIGQQEALCGMVNPEVDCATSVPENCRCLDSTVRCQNPEVDTYSRPITYQSYTGPCAFEIEQKQGPCYRYKLCVNSGGEPGGKCDGNGNQAGYCEVGNWKDVGQQLYYEHIGNCPGTTCVGTE